MPPGSPTSAIPATRQIHKIALIMKLTSILMLMFTIKEMEGMIPAKSQHILSGPTPRHGHSNIFYYIINLLLFGRFKTFWQVPQVGIYAKHFPPPTFFCWPLFTFIISKYNRYFYYVKKNHPDNRSL
jgi:uncharacterized membrane protein YadS